jgi:membrane-bound ClpP family serine protease
MANDNKIHVLSRKEKMTIQLWLAIFLAVMGVILLWVGLFLPPTGVIDASVLTAMGEVFTFSGSLIGIDYSYKFKTIKYLTNAKDNDDTDGDNE